MPYDTIKLRSPSLDRQQVQHIEQQCMLRVGTDMPTGDVLYQIFTGELLASWDSRISVTPKYTEYAIDKNGIPKEQVCEPYLLIEGSVHKIFHGHNVYGGPNDFQAVCSDFVVLLEKLLQTEFPPANQWTVLRADVAFVYRLPKAACKEFFDGIQLISFPRRRKGAAKYDMAVYFPGKTTSVKIYHKGTEFRAHERSRLRGYFTNLFKYLYGWGDLENHDRVERKIRALERLADARLRVEVEIHADKFQYDFEKNPRVDEVTDDYLHTIYDKDVEKLLREGKKGMDTVRESRSVLYRLKDLYGESSGTRLYGFWSSLCTLGDEVTREHFAKSVFYRNRKNLEDAGVSWRGTDVKVISNDSLVPIDFAPIRSDRRLCTLPARNRDEYQVTRDMLQNAA